jgi:hypothetical protein
LTLAESASGPLGPRRTVCSVVQCAVGATVVDCLGAGGLYRLYRAATVNATVQATRYPT